MNKPTNNIFSPHPISGFPEWLPEVRLVELRFIDEIRRSFESYGFCSIETPVVENLRALLAKGETDKEIYAIRRLQADSDDTSDAKLGLHYDLTVPMARYVAQHFADLVFPFKRYQIQKAWRGERPQEGRYREFCQCDIDVINLDQVPLHFDAELPTIIYDIIRRLQIGDFVMKISNRKILEGYYTGLGIEKVMETIRIVDKLDKIGPQGVMRALEEQLQLPAPLASRCLDLAGIRTHDTSFADKVRSLGVQSPLLDQGLEELVFVIESLQHLGTQSIVADLSVARGFDYYTGTVYEGYLVEFPGIGSVCSGGRYENLAASFINRSLPGVGISIGLTRIFAKLAAAGRLPVGRKCPTDILVVLPSEELRTLAVETANTLRQRRYNVEVYHTPAKLSAQLRYASRKGIPYVWFPPFEAGAPHEVKDLTTGQQSVADIASWAPTENIP